MLNWEKPAFSSPFELWKEEGVLFLVLASGATMQVRDMKEVIRLIAALDPSARAPVLLEYPEGVTVEPMARNLLRRVCGAQGHPVAFFTIDPHSRRQGELFKQVQRPAFPFRVFERREQAYNWARERLQRKELLSDRDIPC
jgi:hypothetical protein